MNIRETHIPDDYRIPDKSPLAQLAASLTQEGQVGAAKDIKALSYFQEMEATGKDYNHEAHQRLKDDILKDYLTPTNFEQLAQENAEFHTRLQDMKDYVQNYLDNPQQAKQDMLINAQANVQERRDYVVELKERLKDPNELLWTPIPLENEDKSPADTTNDAGQVFDSNGRLKQHYIEPEFVRIAQDSLSNYEGLLTSVMTKIDDISKDNRPGWDAEYQQSMQKISQFLDAPDNRDNIGFAELPYLIGKHSISSGFRGTTQEKYSEIDVLIERLTPRIPSEENYRQDVDQTHNLVDPRFQEKAYALKIAAVNARNDLGFSSKDIDGFASVVSGLGSIMRGYGIDIIDDRYKQFLHNTGDHSTRTMITAAGLRDAMVKRFEHLHKHDEMSDSELETQKELAQDMTQYMVRKAALHDLGEFLNEVLGNNLTGKTRTEEKLLRQMRDELEDAIMDEYALPSIEKRLADGSFKEQMDKDSIQHFRHTAEEVLGLDISGDHYSKRYDQYDSKFFEMVFEEIERLNSQQDILAFGDIGKINDEGNWQNSGNKTRNDEVYTYNYVASKLFGHKIDSTDIGDQAAYEQQEHERTIQKQTYDTANATASELGVAKPHAPDITRKQDSPDTSLPLDEYHLQRDIDYGKSHFKQLTKQIKQAHATSDSKEEATSKQIHAEALLHAVAFETTYYLKKQARISDSLDEQKVRKASMKSVGQGIAAVSAELKEDDLQLAYLKEPEQIIGQQRYRLSDTKSSEALGGAFGSPEKPNQLVGVSSLIKNVSNIIDGAKGLVTDLVLKPINTIPQIALLKQNEQFSKEAYQSILKHLTATEIGADAAMASVGLAQGQTTGSDQDEAGFDTKSLSLLSPVITSTLQGPKDLKEAVEKSYGHILRKYAPDIAEAHHVPKEAIEALQKPLNIAHGDYERRPTDITTSGKLAEQIFDYFDVKYGQTDRDISDIDQNLVKQIHKAEAYHLRGLIDKEIIKAQDKSTLDVDPAENLRRQDKIELLADAKDSIENNPFFNNRAEHSNVIRFGMVAAFGAAYMASGSGDTLPVPFTDAEIDTSHTFLTLALAGLSTTLVELGQKITRDLPETHPIKRFIDDLPHFELKDDGGIDIVKGSSLKKSELADKTPEEIASHFGKTPGAAQQAIDTTLATVTTPVRALANRNTSNTLFGAQTTMSTVDSGGVISSSMKQADIDPVASTIKAASATTASLMFSQSTVQSMWINEIPKQLERGNDVSYETIQTNISENIKKDTHEWMLNLLTNLAKNTGPIGKAIDGSFDMAIKASGKLTQAIKETQSALGKTLESSDKTLSGFAQSVVKNTIDSPKPKEDKMDFQTRELQKRLASLEKSLTQNQGSQR